MSEKTEQYSKFLKKHLDRIVVVVLFGLFAFMVFLWYQEQNSGATVESGAGKPPDLPDPVKTNPEWKTVSSMSETQDISKHPAIEQVRRYNMFDYKSVREKTAIERDANSKFALAQAAANSGNAVEAKRLLKDILEQFPTHQKARELNEKLNPSTKATGTPGATSPGAPAATPAGATPSPSPAP